MSRERRAAFEFGRTNRRIMTRELGAEDLQGGRRRRGKRRRRRRRSLEAACSQTSHP
jgi:hypothetical protein